MTTMASEGPQVGRLLKRIGKAGFTVPFVRRQMPDWWSVETEAEPGALTDLKIMLARRLGLDLRSVLGDGPITLALPDAVKFKRTVRVAEETPPEPFLAYCTAISRAVAAAMPPSSGFPAADPAVERAAILSDAKVKWVSLNALLRRCWAELGVAVVQVAEVPTNGKGFDAAAFRIDGRVVVLLVKRASHQAWASFWLAHELGHLALGHVAEGEAIFDESDQPDADSEESVADGYGLALLGGAGLVDVLPVGEANAASLAHTALAVGTSRSIDPGHLVLRYARSSGEWEIAQAALARLAPDEDVAGVVNEIAARFLNFDAIGEDSQAALAAALALKV
jgi:hypothetical protein